MIVCKLNIISPLSIILISFVLVLGTSRFFTIRMLTVNDTLEVRYKTKFKFVDVSMNGLTETAIKHPQQFASRDTIKEIPLRNAGRLQKKYYSLPDGDSVYITSQILDHQQLITFFSSNSISSQNNHSLFVLHKDYRSSIGKTSMNNICWIDQLQPISNLDMPTLLENCIRQVYGNNHASNDDQNSQKEPTVFSYLLPNSLWTVIGFLLLPAFTAAKLTLFTHWNRRESVV